MKSVRPFVATLLLVVAACGQDARTAALGDWSEERSLLGSVEIVRTSGEGDGALASLVEEFRIGALDGPEHETYARVYAVAPFSDGTFAVVDNQARRIHYHAEDGSHLRTIGVTGEGPGEFQIISGAVHLAGDRLATYDPRLRRVSVFAADGRFERTIPLLTSGLSSTAVNFLHPAPDGFLLRVNVRPLGATPADGFRLAMVRFDGQSNGRSDTLFVPILPVDPALQMPGAQPGEMMSLPFAPSSRWARHPDGVWVVGTGATYRLYFLGDAGDTVRIVERENTAVPVAAEEAVERRARAEANIRSFLAPDWRWQGPDIPGFKAHFQGLTATPDGNVWVTKHTEAVRVTSGESSLQAQPATTWIEPLVYDVFSSSGRYLGEVRPPDGFELITARGDRVWSREIDALGVPQLVVYRVHWPELIR